MGYMLWDNETKKLIWSKNVTFNEIELYKDKSNKNIEVKKGYVEFEGDEKRKSLQSKFLILGIIQLTVGA